MSILDDIRSEIGNAFSDPALFFSPSTLTRVTGSGGGWNEPETTTVTHQCMAMVEAYSDHLRAVSDIPGEDVKLMIVGASLTVDPIKGDTVTVGGRDWSLIRVDTDPASAMWTCQASPV